MVATALQLSPPATAPFGPGDLKSQRSRGPEFGVLGDWGADRSPRALQRLPVPPELQPVPTHLPPGQRRVYARKSPGDTRLVQHPVLLGDLQPGSELVEVCVSLTPE